MRTARRTPLTWLRIVHGAHLGVMASAARGGLAPAVTWAAGALALAALGLTLTVDPSAAQERYDVVLAGGRVMDPETGLDAVRHVGIRGESVAAISAEPLEGEVAQIVYPDRLALPPRVDLFEAQLAHSHVSKMTSNASA